MRSKKNTIITAALFTALFCTSAFADGDMGSGGKTCPEGQQTCLTGDMGSGGVTSYDGPTKTERTTIGEGDMGSGGLADGIAWFLTYFDWSL